SRSASHLENLGTRDQETGIRNTTLPCPTLPASSFGISLVQASRSFHTPCRSRVHLLDQSAEHNTKRPWNLDLLGSSAVEDCAEVARSVVSSIRSLGSPRLVRSRLKAILERRARLRWQ